MFSFSLPDNRKIRLFLSIGLMILLAIRATAQNPKNNDAPYLTNRNLPAFNIRLLDSTTIFNTATIKKGKATVFILFSPDCDHCAQLAKQIKEGSDSFKNVNLFMVSPPMPLYDIKKFAFINGIAHKPNIVVGQDTEFFFGSFFRAETVPFVVIYNKQKKLVNTLKKMKNVSELWEELHKLK